MYGPVKLCLLSLSSRLPWISVANSDNNIDQVGSVWDFTRELEKGVLNGGARSRSKHLEFRINMGDPGRFREVFELMVLGRLKVFGPATALARE